MKLPTIVSVKSSRQVAGDTWVDTWEKYTLWIEGPEGFLASKNGGLQLEKVKTCVLPLDTQFYNQNRDEMQ